MGGVALSNKSYNRTLSVNSSSGVGGQNLGELYFSDHILEGDEAVGRELLGTYIYKDGVAGVHNGYPEFYDKYSAKMKTAEAQQVVLGDNTITMYISANGYQFYDIADKEAVDDWYNIYGVAWYFGVDEENERIFLPRNDYFYKSGTPENVGSKVTPELPNIKGSADWYAQGAWGKGTNTGTGAIKLSKGTQGGTGQAGNSSVKLEFDASQYDSIYKNGGTVVADGVNILVYMVVGNTKEVTHVRTTIPEGEALEQIYKNKDDIINKVDLTNTQWAMNACSNDYSNGIKITNVPLEASPYIAPCTGEYVISAYHTAAVLFTAYINGEETAYVIRGSASYQSGNTVSIPLVAGESLYWSGAPNSINAQAFYPKKGSN